MQNKNLDSSLKRNCLFFKKKEKTETKFSLNSNKKPWLFMLDNILFYGIGKK